MVSPLLLHTGAYSQPTMMTNHYGDVGHGPIRFYNRDEPYYEFTNFYPAPIDLDGTTWPTTEHYFQAQKFIGTSYPEVIRQFDRPRQAFDLSRNPAVSPWRRKDWEDIKIDIMRKALLAKFTQHKHLRQLLLRTGDRYLIEHSPHDKFWGNGGDDSGGNHLGLLLMEVRQILINLQASLYKQEETVVRVQPHITPDSHRERIQRSESTEKDGQNGLSSSSSSCSMDYTNAGADQSNQNQQNNSTHPDVNNSDDLTRPPLHPVATENTGSPPCQPLAATVGGGSPQVNTPVPITNASATPSSHDQSTSRPTSDPPVGDLINFKDAEPSEEDKVTPMITGGVPKDLAKPLQPMPPAPGPIQCTTHAGRYVSSDTSTDAGKEPASSNEDNHSEKMETDDSNHIH